MKKGSILALVLFIISVLKPVELLAQLSSTPATNTPTTTIVIDEKTQKKIDHTKENIASDQKKRDKEKENYNKEKKKFDKHKLKGKLSPNEIMRAEKSLANIQKNIDKLTKNIEKNQALLESLRPI